MKWWKRIALSLAVVIIGLGSFLAYRAFAKHRDLKETLLWIDQTYNPHDGGANYGRGHGDQTHYLEHPDTHTEEVTEEFHETFIAKSNCTIVLHHETVPVG